MRTWICAQDARIWKIVKEGDQLHTKQTTRKIDLNNGKVEISKPKSKWEEEEGWKKMSSNNKAIKFLRCALAQEIYMIIFSCKTAKEIWDKLNVTYEEDKKYKVYVSWENEDDSSTISDEDEAANTCLMATEDEVSIEANFLNLDNRCSKHMKNDEESLTNYKTIDGGNIIYGESH
ncbi:hypothetical protein PIB30_040627 [Stylosanthes scabra]|uniref:Uncharacterized protein n=1 Tax=Stylosanthes scabra TaxID=79078 RepID=A0ABU6UDC3_9FABA|nr:hypothetical protein [Stylosanthes scabra]